jgi:hypothetical protein
MLKESMKVGADQDVVCDTIFNFCPFESKGAEIK